MEFWHVLVLAVVEGITEFLPVSSTGHLILVSQLLGIGSNEFVKSFEIAIQTGAIMAVLTLYFRKFISDRAIWKPIVSAFIPTTIIGLISYKTIKEIFLVNPHIVALSLITGGIVLVVIDRLYPPKHGQNDAMHLPQVKQSFVIGIIQGLSVIPGVSRAAATTIGGMLVGLSRTEAVEFSFLLALPTIGAATALDIVKTGWKFSTNEYIYLCIGAVVSWMVAYLCMQYFLRILSRNTLFWFGIYRILVGAVTLIIMR